MKRPDSRWLLVSLVCATLLSLHRASAEEPFQCITGDTTISVSYVVIDTFFAYRPGAVQSHERRDIEFQWSDWYTHDLPDSVRIELNFLGGTLASRSRSHNAFNAPITNINLIYDMFLGANRALYDTTLVPPADTVGFVIGSQYGGVSGSPARIRDNAQADVYLYYQGQFIYGERPRNWGMYPSWFCSPWEDIDTGHGVGDVVPSNSMMCYGPGAPRFADSDGTHWTRPNWKWDTTILHEFQHSMPYKNSAAIGGRDEMFSSMAEAISGGLYYCWGWDRELIPYAWSLLRNEYDVNTWGYKRNYELWRHLGAYIGFNFRGQDTTRVLPTDSTGTNGFGDDLVWKWARTTRGLNDLRDLLSDENCWDCAQNTYFEGLSNYERLQLLLHNWRVAEYVNNSSLLEGQYGFPEAFGAFSPAVTRGASERFPTLLGGHPVRASHREGPYDLGDPGHHDRRAPLLGHL
jgi:hypothetical protein